MSSLSNNAAKAVAALAVCVSALASDARAGIASEQGLTFIGAGIGRAAGALVADQAARRMEDCDRLAASPDDPGRKADGVFLRDMDALAAMEACERAVDAVPGERRLAFQLGRAFEAGGRFSEAFESYRFAGDGGYVAAKTALAVLHRRGAGIPRDYARALTLLEEAAALGDGLAMANLGYMLEHGFGTSVDVRRAFELFRASAETGDLLGVSNLAFAFQNGVGVDPDPAEALRLHRIAADRGNTDSFTSLGWFHEHGLAVEMDPSRAAELYERAARLGNLRAMNNLGVLFAEGRGRERDPARAAELYLRAAEGGFSLAMRNLALAHHDGLGVERDDRRAAQWMFRAAAGGEPRAVRDMLERPRRFSATFWRELQGLLEDAGHDPGPIDGRPGPRTRAAIEALSSSATRG